MIDFSALLNTADVAKLFDRSQLTIQLWRKHKALPYIRIGGAKRDTIRYDRKAVIDWATKAGRLIHN